MSIRIPQEYLLRAIWPEFARKKISLHACQMRFPRVQVTHTQRKMVPAIVRMHRFGPVTNDVQFLDRSQSKPSSGKGERWARQWIKSQNSFVKMATRFHIPDVDRNMIEFLHFHGSSFNHLI